MAPYVRRQYGDELYAVMREPKQLCDPAGVLNPGVVLDDDPTAHLRHLRHLRHLKSVPEVDPAVDRCIDAVATAAQAAEITSRDHDAYASCNRTCEMGMSRATGRPYRHILELLEEATR
jgi:hypothetical protein